MKSHELMHGVCVMGRFGATDCINGHGTTWHCCCGTCSIGQVRSELSPLKYGSSVAGCKVEPLQVRRDAWSVLTSGI
jgi:hypothetical protein